MAESLPGDPGAVDILYLLERLEEVLGAGQRLPFTSRTLVDDEECLAIIDQIRLSLPNEIRKARMLNSEREALMDQARAQAEQILANASSESRDLVGEHYVSQQAEAHAAGVVDQAERQATQVRREADEYSYRVLYDLDQRLESLRGQVQNGLDMLRQEVEEDPIEPYRGEPDSPHERTSRGWDVP